MCYIRCLSKLHYAYEIKDKVFLHRRYCCSLGTRIYDPIKCYQYHLSSILQLDGINYIIADIIAFRKKKQ